MQSIMCKLSNITYTVLNIAFRHITPCRCAYTASCMILSLKLFSFYYVLLHFGSAAHLLSALACSFLPNWHMISNRSASLQLPLPMGFLKD